MTTRRGEPYEAETQTVEDILRPLAEATVWPSCTCEFKGEARRGLCILHDGSPRMVLDPRFAALRFVLDAKDYQAPPQWVARMDEIDASLEAIVQAAADYGLGVLGEVLRAIEVAFFHQGEAVNGRLAKEPTEAAARALLAAWRDGKAASSTEPREHHEGG